MLFQPAKLPYWTFFWFMGILKPTTDALFYPLSIPKCNAPCSQVILSIAAGVVAFSSIVLGKALNLAYSAKLYAIAFLIVTFGAGEA